MGTDISADNTGGAAGTVRHDALGGVLQPAVVGLAATLGGWLGNLTREQV
jgi:hypothetical protein